MSVKEIYDKTQNNVFVSTEDIKSIVNQEDNYKVINSKLNRSKSAGTYKECIDKNSSTIGEVQKKEMLRDQRKAEFAVNKKIAKKTIEGIHEVGTEAAKVGATVGAGISVAQNTVRVINGELSLGEAGASVVVDTVKAGAVSYVSGVGVRVIEATAIKASQNAGIFVVSSLNGFIQSGGPAKTLTVISDVGDTVLKYMNGDINDKEFVSELGEKGTCLAMSFGAGAQGGVIGGIIGGVIGSVVPVVGTVTGQAVGLLVGEVVGNMVGYILGSEICKTLKDGTNEYETNIEKHRQLTIFYIQMAEETKRSRIELEKSLSSLQAEHRKILLNAFSDMKNAILENDVDKITSSLQAICQEFGTDVAYKTRDEFDSAMMDEKLSFKIGM